MTETFNRQQIIEEYTRTVVDSMDMETMTQFVYDVIVEDLEELTDEELKDEIVNMAPELLDEQEEI